MSSIEPEELRPVVDGILAVHPSSEDCDARLVVEVLWLASLLGEASENESGPSEQGVTPVGPGKPSGRPRSADEPADEARFTSAEEAARSRSGDAMEIFDLPAPSHRLNRGIEPASLVQVPTVAALPHRLGMARAFRRFRLDVRSKVTRHLDIEGTIRETVLSGRIVPRFAPGTERWLSLHVLIDAAPSMEAWDETLHDLADAARHSGAFRSVATSYLHVTADGVGLGKDRDTEDSQAGRPALGAEPGRTLCVVATDAVERHWYLSDVWSQLYRWCCSAPLAILNPLPVKLWRHTALRADVVGIAGQAGAPPNGRLAFAATGPTGVVSGEFDGLVPIPVIGLAASRVHLWGEATTHGSSRVMGVLASDDGQLVGGADVRADGAGVDPERAVRVFRRIASPSAWRLAVLSATSESTSLAVVRAVQQELLPDSGVEDLAEFIVSGLVRSAAEGARIEFRPGCRDALRTAGGHSVDDAMAVFRAVSSALAARLGISRRALEALVADPDGVLEVPADSIAFAEVAKAALGLVDAVSRDRPPAVLSRGPSNEELWDTGSYVVGHVGGVWGVAFGQLSDERSVLASASGDGTVRLWNPASGTLLLELVGHVGGVWGVAFGVLGDGRSVLASAGVDGTVRLWNPASGTLLLELVGHVGGVWGVAFGVLGDGRSVLASAGGDGTVRLWDPNDGNLIGEPLSHTDDVYGVAFGVLGDGRSVLASAGGDGTVRLWDPNDGDLIGEPLSHTDDVYGVAFGVLGDGRSVLASAGGDGTVRLWDPNDGNLIGDPLSHRNRVLEVAFGVLSDGRNALASASWDGTVRLWDPNDGNLIGDPLSHTDDVYGVAFGVLGDGRSVLASASWDRTIRLWTGAERAQETEMSAPPSIDGVADRQYRKDDVPTVRGGLSPDPVSGSDLSTLPDPTPDVPPPSSNPSTASPADSREMVMGIFCSRSHFNNPNAMYCQVCGISLVHHRYDLALGERPALGFIVFDDGSTFSLDRNYLVGRGPGEVSDPSYTALKISDNNETLSRRHAEIRLIEWTVNIVDLGSTNGTFIWDYEAEQWNLISPGDPVPLSTGDTVALGRRTFVFESINRL